MDARASLWPWLLSGVVLIAMGSCNDGAGAQARDSAGENHAPTARPAQPASPASQRGADFVLAGQQTQGGWLRGMAPLGTQAITFDGEPVAMADDGSFIIAFDRDAAASATLVAKLADGRSLARTLTVSPRAWNIERVGVGPRPGAVPSEEFARRRAIELARINAARASSHAVEGWRQRFTWPARGRLSGMFGSQRIYNGTPGSYHSGTDIAGGGGAPYYAPADGVVILAAESPFTLEGNLLMIDHGMGLNSAFLHSSRLAVKEGDVVRQGQLLGYIGMTGRATGPHLHWSIKWHKARLDPILFTGPMPSPGK